MTVERVDADPDGAVADLFVQYRHFYGRSGDDDAARAFFQERLDRSDSLIWAARSESRVEGFAQVYAGHSSIRLSTDWLLNDLFVARHARGAGVGRSLVVRVLDDARAAAVGVVRLETHHDNRTARALYEDRGFAVVSEQPSGDGFLTYERRIAGDA